MLANRFGRVGGAAFVLLALLAAGCGAAQSPGSVEDAQITAQVKAMLASDISPSTVTAIEVNTTNGVVTLAGEVASEEIKDSAEMIARAVPGVVDVNNNLQVNPAAAG